MNKLFFCFILFFTFNSVQSFAQETLPNISVKSVSGRVIISWKNEYGGRISAIKIQRSSDSLKNFTSFASVLNPMNKQNGIVDVKPPFAKTYYRVFVAFENGDYVFSRTHLPNSDSVRDEVEDITPKDNGNRKIDTVIIVPPVITYNYVYIGKDNNVIINILKETEKKYSIKFFDENKKPVFEIKKIKEPFLILDKVNFIKAGWYSFKLYKEKEMIEEGRILISKDIKKSQP
jgi:hypothetical protein